MQSEEAVAHDVALLLAPVPFGQQGTHPGGRMLLLLEAVAVGAIGHHLAVTDTLVAVDLPEDDTPLAVGTQTVTTHSIEHLLPSEVAGADQCLAKTAIDTQALTPHLLLPI